MLPASPTVPHFLQLPLRSPEQTRSLQTQSKIAVRILRRSCMNVFSGATVCNPEPGIPVHGVKGSSRPRFLTGTHSPRRSPLPKTQRPDFHPAVSHTRFFFHTAHTGHQQHAVRI